MSLSLSDLIWLNALTLLRYEHRLLAKGKKLTSDGVQWCAGTEGVAGFFTTTEVGVLQEAFRMYINPRVGGVPNWIELGLTIGLLASAATSSGKWQWQGSINGTAWGDLFDLVTETSTIGTAEVERTRQGFALLSVLTQVPFYVRLMVQCDTVAQTIRARVKSSSYAICVYQASSV